MPNDTRSYVLINNERNLYHSDLKYDITRYSNNNDSDRSSYFFGLETRENDEIDDGYLVRFTLTTNPNKLTLPLEGTYKLLTPEDLEARDFDFKIFNINVNRFLPKSNAPNIWVTEGEIVVIKHNISYQLKGNFLINNGDTMILNYVMNK